MNRPPSNLGNHLLIAIADWPATLATIRAVADNLPDPARTEITLLHHLMPTYWEHGGAEDEADEAEVEQEVATQFKNERAEEAVVARYFAQAQSLLAQAGVPPLSIHTRLDSDANTVADAILDELSREPYSTVVIGQHHQDRLMQMLGVDLADMLRRRSHGMVNVWVVATPVAGPTDGTE